MLVAIVLIFISLTTSAQRKWNYDFGLGASLNSGNVNNFNLSNGASVFRNDSTIALDFHYGFLYSSQIYKENETRKWEESNKEISGGVKMDIFQYDKYSPFLACEMLSNKYKGYDFKVSGLVGVKFKLYTNPGVCDYSISAAFVYDWTDFTDSTTLPNNNYRLSIRPKFKQKIGDKLTLSNCTFYQPSVLDWGDCIVSSVTKLQTQLTKILYLDLSFTYDYRSRVPSDDYRKHDIYTEISLRVRI